MHSASSNTLSRSSSDGRRFAISFQATLLVCFSLLLLTTIPGCNGCSQDPVAKKKKEEEDKKKKDKKKNEKPKEPFEFGRLELLPQDKTMTRNFVKPGHWVTASRAIKANNFDFPGELESAATYKGDTPIDVAGTLYQVSSSRPATLPKGQTRFFESNYFVPRPTKDTNGNVRRIWFRNQLRARRGGREVFSGSNPTTTLPDYQYFMVVLSDESEAFGYLKTLDSVQLPEGTGMDEMNDESMMGMPVQNMGDILHYRVVLPKIENRVPVPSQPMSWTIVAYVVWDGLNPNLMTPDQQQAMIDWLHWGGQLIVSGPNSLDSLRGSFLEKYLPASSAETLPLEQARFDELNAHWSLSGMFPVKDAPGRRVRKSLTLEFDPDKPPIGVNLKLHPDAKSTPNTGDLVAERRVGGGRIVVTAFSLRNRRVINWGSFPGFFNACLLRRPARTFDVDGTLVKASWIGIPNKQRDARLVTKMRYFSRDVGLGSEVGHNEVAGWDDRSGVADASRDALIKAAGISVPKAEFVFKVLAVYLLILVPVNWLLFRLIGRVEWAWVAAPIISLIGAGAVIKLAQLDIGFARSRTEIAVLEMNGGYHRGHLTRFTALYTSLATSYDFVFDADSAVARPFPEDPSRTRGLNDSTYAVQYRRDKKVSLTDFQVRSSDTGYVHSEQMYNAGGAVTLVDDKVIKNDTKLPLSQVGVIRKQNNRIEFAWLGRLEAESSSKPLNWQQYNSGGNGSFSFSQWKDESTSYSYDAQRTEIMKKYDKDRDKKLSKRELQDNAELMAYFDLADRDNNNELSNSKGGEKEIDLLCIKTREGEVTLGQLFELAARRIPLRNGDARLIGWTDQILGGLTITPTASQNKLHTLMLVHLRRGPYGEPKRDSNTSAEKQALALLRLEQREQEDLRDFPNNPNADPFAPPRNR